MRKKFFVIVFCFILISCTRIEGLHFNAYSLSSSNNNYQSQKIVLSSDNHDLGSVYANFTQAQQFMHNLNMLSSPISIVVENALLPHHSVRSTFVDFIIPPVQQLLLTLIQQEVTYNRPRTRIPTLFFMGSPQEFVQQTAHIIFGRNNNFVEPAPHLSFFGVESRHLVDFTEYDCIFGININKNSPQAAVLQKLRTRMQEMVCPQDLFDQINILDHYIKNAPTPAAQQIFTDILKKFLPAQSHLKNKILTKSPCSIYLASLFRYLVDAHILWHIINPDAPTRILVLAGDFHIQNVLKHLHALGYTLNDTFERNTFYPYFSKEFTHTIPEKAAAGLAADAPAIRLPTPER